MRTGESRRYPVFLPVVCHASSFSASRLKVYCIYNNTNFGACQAKNCEKLRKTGQQHLLFERQNSLKIKPFWG
jgi:hypothetical protein